MNLSQAIYEYTIDLAADMAQVHAEDQLQTLIE